MKLLKGPSYGGTAHDAAISVSRRRTAKHRFLQWIGDGATGGDQRAYENTHQKFFHWPILSSTMIAGGIALIQPLVAKKFRDGGVLAGSLFSVALEARGQGQFARAIPEDFRCHE